MSDNKYWRVVKALIRKTNSGEAKWEPTPVDGVFSISLPDYSIRIWRSEDDVGSQRVMFSIVDSSGTVIDTFSDGEIRAGVNPTQTIETYREVTRLAESARRQAMGIDKALDSLIEELERE
jgi:hypothetical protein